MSTTRLDIAVACQSILEDVSGTFYTANDLNDSIQDGYDEICCVTGLIEKVVTLPFLSGQIYYNLYDSIPGFLRINKLFSKAINRWLRFFDVRFFGAQRFDWECSLSTAWWSAIINYQYITFFSHYGPPITADFDCMVNIGHDELVDNTTLLQIPDQYINGLVNYVIADMLEQAQEFTKAQDYWAEYGVITDLLKTHCVNRMNPWIFEQLEDIYFPEGAVP